MSGIYNRGPRVPKIKKQINFRLPPDYIEFLETEALRQTASPPYYYVSVSDVIRNAVNYYRTHQASPMIEVKPPCNIVQNADLTGCLVCGLRWDTNDPFPPTCLMKTKGQ